MLWCIAAKADSTDQIYKHSSYAPLDCFKMSNSDPKTHQRPGPWPPAPDANPMPPSSWAKKTGFKPKFSGETNASDSGQISMPPRPKEPQAQPDSKAGRVRTPTTVNGETKTGKVPPSNKDQPVKRRRDSDGVPKSSVPSTNGQAPAAGPGDQQPQPRRTSRHEEVIDIVPQTVDDDGFGARHSHMKYELRDSPGLGTFACINSI